MYCFKEFNQSVILKNHLNLGGENPKGERIEVTSAYFLRGNKPWIGVMGEFHFSRYDRIYWHDELCKMKAGGITLVSTYLFWIYHEEIEGEFNFSGNNDIRAFIMECRKVGLEVVIRIGPWAHGECRNGGFPDWLLKKPFPLRDNNAGYMEKVRIWYKKIYEQVQGLFFKDGGNIIAVQLENEFCNDAGHLALLKKAAIECGIIVPLYTVTGWNSAAGAQIPVDEVVPVFGGYCDAPWEQHTRQLPPSPHYFFNRMRNDSAIGADLIPRTIEEGWRLPYDRYPFATCELGGGLQVTHHRRPIISGMDIYAVSLVKLGCGNNLAGYYMYHGGTHQIGKLSTFQESRDTGYPNDYTILSYDFQAPISEYGEIREQYRLLNLLHLFLQDFGDVFAPMTAVDASNTVKRDDTASLRYGMRTDGKSGFIFVNHCQRLTKLEDVKDAVIDTGVVVFPPVDICGEISFFMPFHMNLYGNDLEYATTQPLCRQGDTWFFAEIPGIPAEYQFSDGLKFSPQAGLQSMFSINGAHVVTLTWDQARYLRRLEGELYIGEDCDLFQSGERIQSVENGEFNYYHWNGMSFQRKSICQPYKEPEIIFEQLEKPPFQPKYAQQLNFGGNRAVVWKKIRVDGCQGFVSIEDVCDVAQIYANGELAADNFYYGRPWRVPARLLAGKECHLVMSEIRDDFYREFDQESSS